MKISFRCSREEVLHIKREEERYLTRRFSDQKLSRLYWHLLMPAAIAAAGVLGGSFGTAILACSFFYAATALGGRLHRARLAKNLESEENLVLSLLPFELELLADRVILSNPVIIHHYLWRG